MPLVCKICNQIALYVYQHPAEEHPIEMGKLMIQLKQKGIIGDNIGIGHTKDGRFAQSGNIIIKNISDEALEAIKNTFFENISGFAVQEIRCKDCDYSTFDEARGMICYSAGHKIYAV